MKLIIQRTTEASITINGEFGGQIEKGFVVLIGVCNDDTKEVADKMLKKMLGLRIFEDENGKTNLSLNDVSGQLMVVSQFTLYADCKKGNRPSFTNAGSPAHAEEIYDYVIDQIKSNYSGKLVTGSFGADMKISLVNDGPFTIILDSKELQ